MAINCHLFKAGDVIRVRDVELKKTDSDQRHREKLARIILNEMYQFVALLDAQGTLLEANRVALAGSGEELSEIAGKPFWETRSWAISTATQDRLKDAIRRAAAGEFVRYDVEIFGGASGSETIIIDFSLIPVTDHTGKVVFIVPEGRNITEKKLAEAEIARKNLELEKLLGKIRELDELKSHFFANVSHELRTPLALILGPVHKILEEGDNLTPLQRRDLEVVGRNASLLLKHVNDLLDISKLEAGKMSADYAEVDFARLVRIIAGHFDALAPQRGISYVIDTPDTLSAELDPEKIERVVLNLLSNAFKFTPDGGRIRCALQDLGDGWALLSVEDSGPGIKVENREKIFERFRQGDAGDARRFGGTGLGLAIAKDFVDLHGGTIGLDEADGGGAQFQVRLPLKAPAGAFVRQKADIQASQNPSLSQGVMEELKPLDVGTVIQTAADDAPLVLVVEDNPEMRRFLAESLLKDYRVLTAQDGEEGLRQLEENRPDLVITDIMMPKMSGDQMIARIRRNAAFDAMPILILSAKADEALRIRLLKSGAQDYVVKPFSSEEVLARVRLIIGGNGAKRQVSQVLF